MKVICTTRSRNFILGLTPKEKDELRNTVQQIQEDLPTINKDKTSDDVRMEFISNQLYFTYKTIWPTIHILQIGHVFELDRNFVSSVNRLADADKYKGPYVASIEDGTETLVDLKTKGHLAEIVKRGSVETEIAALSQRIHDLGQRILTKRDHRVRIDLVSMIRKRRLLIDYLNRRDHRGPRL